MQLDVIVERVLSYGEKKIDNYKQGFVVYFSKLSFVVAL